MKSTDRIITWGFLGLMRMLRYSYPTEDAMCMSDIYLVNQFTTTDYLLL